MSHWIDIKKNDIDIDGEDIDVFIGRDEFGVNYITIKIKDLVEVIKETKINDNFRDMLIEAIAKEKHAIIKKS